MNEQNNYFSGAPEGKLWGNIPGGPLPPEQPPPPPPTTTTTTTTTTYRPWKPTKPNHYPDDDRPRQPGRYPQKPDYRPHKPHRHHTTWSTTTMRSTPKFRHRWTPRDDVPDKCDTSYDAISIIRREVFIFKGRVSSNQTKNKKKRIIRNYEKNFLSLLVSMKMSLLAPLFHFIARENNLDLFSKGKKMSAQRFIYLFDCRP